MRIKKPSVLSSLGAFALSACSCQPTQPAAEQEKPVSKEFFTLGTDAYINLKDAEYKNTSIYLNTGDCVKIDPANQSTAQTGKTAVQFTYQGKTLKTQIESSFLKPSTIDSQTQCNATMNVKKITPVDQRPENVLPRLYVVGKNDASLPIYPTRDEGASPSGNAFSNACVSVDNKDHGVSRVGITIRNAAGVVAHGFMNPMTLYAQDNTANTPEKVAACRGEYEMFSPSVGQP
ncbi:MAG: hypothetical protein DI551_04255 [Micavibrio aeruginosavorus]|uniref:Lipoprotein n=1 Tax=Micavibrio aeruginosavorus TaxID=349221 RepID=A0A2W5N2P1_9BACT|nr:MAG: hypothetical protein DI551_04255 [Micavibrio aeruginosavorus]